MLHRSEWKQREYNRFIEYFEASKKYPLWYLPAGKKEKTGFQERVNLSYPMKIRDYADLINV